MNKLTFSLLLALITNTLASAATPWISGFWSAGNSRESLASIPWSKYTQIVYFAATTGANGTVYPQFTSQPEMSNIVAAAHANGKKILICIGDGDGSGQVSFTQDTSTPNLISTLASNVAAFVNNNGFDGLEMDWEQQLDNSTEAAQYEAFVTALRPLISGKIFAVDALVSTPMETAIAASQSKLDQINIECYDMDNVYLNGGPKPWYNGSIYDTGIISGQGADAQWRVQKYLSSGVAASKIGIGIPFYGRRWSGATLINQGKGSITTWFPYSSLVQDSTRWQPANTFYDSTYGSDYLSIPSLNEFDSFTGVKSLQAIVEYGKSKGLGGYMVFTQEYEYISGASGDARYPLSSVLYAAVFGGSTAYTAPSITSTSPLAAGTVGTAYSLSVNSSGTTPMTWAVTSGALPSGLLLSSSDGVISGMPSTAASSSFTVEASNAAGNSSRQFSLTVNPKSTTASSSWFNLVSEQSGKCLDVTGMSTSENVQLQQWACWGGDNQKFQFTPVIGGYKITAKNSGLQLNVRGGESAIQNGAAIIQWPYGGASNETWNTHPNVDGSYFLTVNNSGKCMDVAGSSTSDGATIDQWQCTGGANQKWTLAPTQ